MCVASKSADQRASYRRGDIEGAKMTHINLLGEYDFSYEKLRDSVGSRPPRSLALPTS